MTVYLDHAATTAMPRAVIEAMWPYMTDNYGNASSQHEVGKRAAVGLQAAREIIASVLNCRPGEVIFTSGGTESDNLAIKGVALANPKARHIITSAIEHEAVLETCRFLERLYDFRLTVLPVDGSGLVDLAALREAISPNTTLCSIQYANSDVGTVQAIAEIAETCRQLGVTFHTDAVQAAGILPCNIDDLGADLLSISGHKFGGPKATGVLVARSNVFLEPVLHGGGQERGARSGTSNVAGAIGLATALLLAEQERDANARVFTTMRDELIDGVAKLTVPSLLTGHRTQRLPQHASFCFPGLSGERLLLDLETRGFACASGSACTADRQEPSPTLLAMGIDEEVARTAVRFTLGTENTHEHISGLLRALAASVH